jgi:hypothetical protein
MKLLGEVCQMIDVEKGQKEEANRQEGINITFTA